MLPEIWSCKFGSEVIRVILQLDGTCHRELVPCDFPLAVLHTIQLSSNLDMTFGMELVVLHTVPFMFGKRLVSFRCMLGGLNKEHSKSIIEGETHFGMPRGA